MNLQKYLLLLCLGILFACKKEIKNPPQPPEPTEEERLMADIYDYYNKYSLWTAQIPDLDEQGRLEFVRKYSSNGVLLNALMNMTPAYDFRCYTTISPRCPRKHYDRYSFLDESNTDGNLSYADGFRMDTNEGYGLYFGWGLMGEIIDGVEYARPVISFVEGGSPSHTQGVTRGAVVYAINDDDNITVRYSSGSLNPTDLNNFGAKLDAALAANSLKLKVETVNGEEVEYTMEHDTYEIDPVVKHTIYEYSKNVGYLAYSSFEEVWPKTHQNYTKLEGIFNSLKNANVRDLILDLRYNTGGYVSTAEYLADKLVNAADDGKLMFKYKVNDYLATSLQHKSDFQDVYFDNSDNQLELENIYILVTEQTASAAELLISALQPYLNVTIIAETDRTYGKPVGFFPEEIDDVTLWVTSFQTINANGYTDYWNGITPDVSGVPDYFFKDFGDPEEDMIAKALDLAIPTNNGFRASSRKRSAQRGISMGIINKVKERNMLKIKD